MTKLEKLTAWAKVVPVYRDKNGNRYFEPVEGYREHIRRIEDWPEVICSWYPLHYFNSPTPEEEHQLLFESEEARTILWTRMTAAPRIEIRCDE